MSTCLSSNERAYLIVIKCEWAINVDFHPQFDGKLCKSYCEWEIDWMEFNRIAIIIIKWKKIRVGCPFSAWMEHLHFRALAEYTSMCVCVHGTCIDDANQMTSNSIVRRHDNKKNREKNMIFSILHIICTLCVADDEPSSTTWTLLFLCIASILLHAQMRNKKFYKIIFASVIFNLHINPLHYSVHSFAVWRWHVMPLLIFVWWVCYGAVRAKIAARTVATQPHTAVWQLRGGHPAPTPLFCKVEQKKKIAVTILKPYNPILPAQFGTHTCNRIHSHTHTSTYKYIIHYDAYSLIKRKVLFECVHHHGQD